jgi:hypothetical protein
MTWAVSPFPVKETAAVNSLMLALGKSLHLACEFERKCQYVLRILNSAKMFESTGDARATFAAAKVAKDRMLGKTIEGMARTGALPIEEVDCLIAALNARNYIAHESSKIGSLHMIRADHITEIFATLRPNIIDLAKGDNIISMWDLAIQEKQEAPKWMTETYEARVLSWIFGEPFHGVSSSDEWAARELTKRCKQ